MVDIIQIIEGVFPKCSNLEIKTRKDLLDIMWAMNLLGFNKINQRIFDSEMDSDNFIDFISNIKMFGLESKGEVRKLITNNGIKVNNKPPSEKISDIEWIKLEQIEFAVIKKGKKDFDFIFNTFG